LATTINATTNNTLYYTPDNTGILDLQTGGSTAQSIGTDQSTTFANTVQLAVGTSSIAPLDFLAKPNTTTSITGSCEYDANTFYGTIGTTLGRGAIPVFNEFKLIAAGTTVTTTIGNYFGTTSNIPLVASAFYEIEIILYFLKTTAGTVTWTLTNSAAPISQDIYYEMSPFTGIVAPPGTATMLKGQVYNDTTAAYAFSTGTNLSSAANHYARFKIFLDNGSGTSLKIQATCSAGSITPGIGSRWSARKLPAINNSNYSA